MNSRVVVILGIVVLAVVASAIWFLQMQPTGPAITAAPPTPAPASTAGGPPPPESPSTAATSQPSAPAPMRETAPPAAPRQLTDWEQKIDQVLQTQAGETQMAQMLINAIPTMPPEGQAEAAQHVSNLVTDKDYNLVMPMLRNTALAEQVHDVLVTDLMNRDDTVKLPALLEVAKIPNHPYHEEALTDLQIFLDQDNGNNWGKWDQSVQEYLRKLKAEEAASGAAPVQ